MLVYDLMLNTAWCIMPEKLNEILHVVESKQLGELDAEAYAANARQVQDNNRYTIKDGIATLKVRGTLAKRMNLLSAMSGTSSYEIIERDFKNALNDSDVKTILLAIDSPGGAVDGMASLGNLIYQSRGKKRIIAYADGLMASAAYYIGSAAHEVVASDNTTQTGSLGVIGIHFDRSKQYEQKGIAPTVLKAGKFKAVGNEYSPLSKGDKEDLQGRLDYLYGLMTKDIAKNRGASPDIVDKKMAQGRVFIGQQAVEAGLVDRIESWDSLLTRLRSKTNNYSVSAIKNARSDYVKIEHFDLKSIVESLQSCDNLDELKSLENQCLLHFEKVKRSAKNWLEKEKAESMSRQVIQLISHRRRQIMSMPTQKDLDDYALGRAIACRHKKTWMTMR